jgi:exodeoxyribonuclease VII small subunit
MRVMPRKKEMPFEESLSRLEEIVEAMEKGDMSLKDLMAAYSEGVTLSQSCLKALDRAEKAMDLMVQEKQGKAEENVLSIEEN